MIDPLAITIIFIVVATLVAAFVRGRKKDKCLKDFRGNMVTLEDTAGKAIWGVLRVENTGIELVYAAVRKDSQGHDEASYILYKYEYPKIAAFVRYHDQLSEQNRRVRDKVLERTYHPGVFSRLRRKTGNVFKTVRDSVAEVVNLLISRAKATTGVGATLSSQDKYVSQMKQELMGSVGTSYEPLLERYIGHKVVVELVRGEKAIEYVGVLKDYTAEFIEIMDVDYSHGEEEQGRTADLVLLRKVGVVRHLGEKAGK